MIFGIFGRTKHHPLTDYCTKLSAPTNLLKTASVRIADVLPGISKQHIVLSLILAAAAGDFVKNLRWEGSRRYLKSTNLDVITAEAIIWMYFLMVRFYLADQKRALIDDFAFPQALSDALFVIQDKTGFDFEKTGFKRWQRYCESVENREDVSLVFASIVLHSVGRQSLPVDEEKAFLRSAAAAIPRIAEIICGFPPNDRAGGLETAERRFMEAALEFGCTETAARSRVSAVMGRLRRRVEGQQISEEKLQALLQRLTESD